LVQVGAVSQPAATTPVAGAGVTALAVASVFQATFTAPVAWFIAVGTAWQLLQASAPVRSVVPVRCFWCAPTLTLVVAVVPLVATGGAAFTPDPWQLVQVALVCRAPLMCSVVADVPVPLKTIPPAAFTTAAWHGLHAVAGDGFATDVCAASFGGDAWHDPQVALVVVVHVQLVTLPRCAAVSDAPWQ
jgi:hypothetical protein